MSTRCLIAVIENDGTGQYIYCGSDGYPEWVGRLLLTYYPSKEMALEIMKLGDLRCLGRALATDSDTERTTAKYRDLGECWKDSAPNRLSQGLVDLDRMIKEPYRTDAEYIYAFVGNCWMIYIRDYHVWKVLSAHPMQSDCLINPLLYPKAIKDQPLETLEIEYSRLTRLLSGSTSVIVKGAIELRERIVNEIRRRGLNFHEVMSEEGEPCESN